MERNYPISPDLCLKLEGLEQLPQWEAFLQWLKEQEDSHLNNLKVTPLNNLEGLALQAAASTSALKQIGRIQTLPTVVNKILEAYRKTES